MTRSHPGGRTGKLILDKKGVVRLGVPPNRIDLLTSISGDVSLFDVETGMLLLTARRRVEGQRWSKVWHTGEKLAALRRRLTGPAVVALATELRG